VITMNREQGTVQTPTSHEGVALCKFARLRCISARAPVQENSPVYAIRHVECDFELEEGDGSKVTLEEKKKSIPQATNPIFASHDRRTS
jgi:hypothetical protein